MESMQNPSYDQLPLDHLTDRELLILVCQKVNGLCSSVDKQNGRLRKLEDWRNITLGAVGLVGVGVPLLISLLIK